MIMLLKKCSKCKINKAEKHKIYGYIHCKSCRAKDEDVSTEARDLMPVSRLHRIQKARDHSGKDMLQPYDRGKPNPEFFKAYPDRVKDYGVSKDLQKL